jgi:CheY-like chemotaxis protein
MTPVQVLPKKILVVEDDTATRHALTQLLREEGYAVAGVANGREAIDRLRERGAPDLILLDLWMPVMDGRQFRTEQRRDPTLASVPVVLLSADGTIQQDAAAIGADEFLQKPFELDNLLDTVHRWC